MKGEKQSTGGSLQRHIAAGREIQIIPLFVPALNNYSKSLFFSFFFSLCFLWGFLFVCLTCTDLCCMAAVRTAQNELSLGEKLAESSGQEIPLLKSRNFPIPSRFGSCKVSNWDLGHQEEFPLDKIKTHRPERPVMPCFSLIRL